MTKELGNDVPIETDVFVRRKLGLPSGISFIVGTIIGSGIFISPKGVLLGTGSVGLCLVAWGVSAVISLCGALVMAELGLLVPKSGGPYIYLLRAFGTFPAFLFVWVHSTVISPGSLLIKSLTVAEYVSRATIDDCQRTKGWTKLLAACVIISVTTINILSVRLAARTQVLFSIIKVGGLLVIIGGGIHQLAIGNPGILDTGFEGSTTELSEFAVALYSGLWAYGGWGNLNYAVEELKTPKRNLPLSIGLSMVIVVFIYMLVNVSYFTLLTKEEFLSSWAVGVTWAEKLFGRGAIFVPIIVACSVFGSANGGAFVGSRVIFAAARDHNFPEVFCYLNVHSLIPTPSVIFMTLLSLLYLILPGNVGSVINVMGFISWGTWGLVMVSHIVFKFKEDTKNIPRLIRVPLLVSVIMLLMCLYLVVAPFLSGFRMEYIFAFAVLAAGVLLYFLFIYFRLAIPGSGMVYSFLQLLLEVSPPSQLTD
ncbi:b(0,+)-type amino acid transporter 1-like isoform X2 [Ostrea edulis]|nr:b(0,+)-type amino acid transporter 1-like isoform X2 [Ostrea edulis]XP_048748196.1 b(0,+)-type amino acid transporter 1-like isoform X2 [Ostrea edulis]